jgi:hypothetical protein
MENVEIAYQIILIDAVDEANKDDRKPWFLGGDFFQLPPGHDYTSLALHYDPDAFRAAVESTGADEDAVVDTLTAIARDAIYAAIMNNPGMLGGLMLNELRRHNGDPS